MSQNYARLSREVLVVWRRRLHSGSATPAPYFSAAARRLVSSRQPYIRRRREYLRRPSARLWRVDAAGKIEHRPLDPFTSPPRQPPRKPGHAFFAQLPHPAFSHVMVDHHGPISAQAYRPPALRHSRQGGARTGHKLYGKHLKGTELGAAMNAGISW